MSLKALLDKLEHLAPAYFKVWRLDDNDPDLYPYEGETLTRDALNERARTKPGLTVVRITRHICGPVLT